MENPFRGPQPERYPQRPDPSGDRGPLAEEQTKFFNNTRGPAPANNPRSGPYAQNTGFPPGQAFAAGQNSGFSPGQTFVAGQNPGVVNAPQRPPTVDTPQQGYSLPSRSLSIDQPGLANQQTPPFNAGRQPPPPGAFPQNGYVRGPAMPPPNQPPQNGYMRGPAQPPSNQSPQNGYVRGPAQPPNQPAQPPQNGYVRGPAQPPSNQPAQPPQNGYVRGPAQPPPNQPPQTPMAYRAPFPAADFSSPLPVTPYDASQSSQFGRWLKRLVSIGLTRLQEPQPEGLLTRGVQAIQLDVGLGLAPVLALTNTLGLFIVAFSYYVSNWGEPYPIVETCFLGGLLLLFVPNLVRLLSRTPSRLERILLLAVLAFSCYFLHFMGSPLHFSGFDETLHWRTADDILRTGHLFSSNSMLPVSPYYPGLEIVTNAISATTGLNTFYAGSIIVAVARLLMVLALYLLFEQMTDSSRMASIAMLAYMTNQHFLFFDAIYSYETLALPLAVFAFYILARYQKADQNYRWVVATAWIVLAAVTVTHHMTDYFFDGLLLLWAMVGLFRPTLGRARIHLVAIALFALLLSLLYTFFLPGNPVQSYLISYFGTSFNQLNQIITGQIIARPLFTNSVNVAPLWDRVLITGSVALVTFSLPFALLVLQRLHRGEALAVTFGFVSLIFPLTQAFRLTSAGTEITGRSAPFLFLPVAYMLTILITHFWPTRKLTRKTIALISGAILVIFLGNIIVATGPNLTGIPGSYLVGADGRSVEPEGISAAQWSLAYLGPDNRMATDRTDQMLQSTFGDQRIVTRIGDQINVAPLFFSAQFDNADVTLLREGKIQYLVVDTRISTGLPLVGTYFEDDRPTTAISKDALTKFTTVLPMNKYFDSGDIVIYETGILLH